MKVFIAICKWFAGAHQGGIHAMAHGCWLYQLIVSLLLFHHFAWLQPSVSTDAVLFDRSWHNPYIPVIMVLFRSFLSALQNESVNSWNQPTSQPHGIIHLDARKHCLPVIFYMENVPSAKICQEAIWTTFDVHRFAHSNHLITVQRISLFRSLYIFSYFCAYLNTLWDFELGRLDKVLSHMIRVFLINPCMHVLSISFKQMYIGDYVKTHTNCKIPTYHNEDLWIKANQLKKQF